MNAENMNVARIAIILSSQYRLIYVIVVQIWNKFSPTELVLQSQTKINIVCFL